MAAKLPSLNQKITLDGEKEYRAALKDVGAGLRVLDSEMDKTRATFAGSEKSVEALSATQDVLSRKLSTQHDKVELLRGALQQAARTYGESDARTMKWQESLNKAEAEELRLQRQIDDCSAAIDRQSGAMEDVGEATGKATAKTKQLGDAVGDAAGKLGINLPQGATNALNSLGGLSAGAAAALAGFAALAAGIVKVEKALIDMTKQAAQSADELETLSMKTGLTTQSLQELQYAAEFIDVDLDTITSSLTKLTNSMDDARDGSQKATDAFARLGVTVTDESGQLRSAEDVFYDTIDALGRIGNATERDALAMDVFGKSAQELNPLIVRGSAALKDLAKEANATGYVLDALAVKKLAAVDDAFQKLELSRETFTRKLSVEFAPVTEKALGMLSDMIDKVGDALVKSGAVDAFASILDSVTAMIPSLVSIASSILPMVANALKPVAKFLAWVADAIDLIRSLSPNNWGQGLAAKALGWNIYNPSNTQQFDTYSKFGLTWNSSDLHWEDSSGNIFYATKTGPSAVGSPSFRTTQEKYADWVDAGGADGNGNGSYEWWYNYVYSGRNAGGTSNWRGGLTWVGENGPELALLPRGTSITSASESRETGGDVFNIYVDAKNIRELNDLVRIAQTARMNARKAVS